MKTSSPHPAADRPSHAARLRTALAAAGVLLAGALWWALAAAGPALAPGWQAVAGVLVGLNLCLLWLSGSDAGRAIPPRPAPPVAVAAPLPPLPALEGPAGALQAELYAGRLALAYRPQRALPQGRVLAMQVQARWEHPQRGLLAGDDLLAFAGEHGLLEPLLQAWLGGASEQLARWTRGFGARGPALICLDLPAAVATRPGLDGLLLQALAGHGLAPNQLRLQVPEAPSSGRDAAAAPLPGRLPALAAAGVGLAVSHFGAAGSSLAALAQWPVDAVVLDSELVARVQGSGHHRMVIEAAARLAASRGIQTVADGVATPDDAVALAELGCDGGLGDALGPWLDGPAWTERWDAPVDAAQPA